MPVRDLRVVLVGAGHRARTTYLPWLATEHPHIAIRPRPVAVLDPDPAALISALAELPPGRPVLTALPEDLGQVLDVTRPDLLIVASPDATHTPHVLAALTRDVSVLVEKPLTTTPTDAARILAAEQQAAPGVRVLVGHNLRFTPLHTRVRDLLADGTIGTVTGGHFDYTLRPGHGLAYLTRWHRRRTHSGGLEITKAVHHLDLLAWWLDSPATAVTARTRRVFWPPDTPGVPADADIEDSIHALVEYGPIPVHYSLTAKSPTEGYTCTLHGTCGRATVTYNAHQGEPTVRLQFTDPARPETTEVLAREGGRHAGADARMLAALPAAVLDDGPGFATAVEAARAVTTAATLTQSAATGRRLPVPDPEARP
ncbi:Gfo/Idh/MocA family protein [Streptomyces sp. NPDC054865]